MVYDLFVVAILLFTTYRGAAKGVAWQLAGIGAMVLCFLFATPLSLVVAPMIHIDPPLNRWVAMLVIYLVFCCLTFGVARAFRGALEKAKFQEFDRHLGGVFGLLKGAVIGLVCTFFAVGMSQSSRDFVLTTYTGYASAHIMNAIDPVMPAELHAILEPYLQHLDVLTPELAAERERRRHENEDPLEEDPGYRNNDPLLDSGDDPFIPSSSNSGSGRPSGYRPIGESSGTTRPTTPRPAPSRNTASRRQLDEQTIQDLLDRLPEDLDPATRDQIARSLRAAGEQERPKLMDQIKSVLPSWNDLASSWSGNSSTPAPKPVNPPRLTSPSRPVPVEPDPRVLPRSTRPFDDFEDDPLPAPQPNRIDIEKLTQIRQQYLRDIAKVFTSQPDEQALLMTEVESDLLGLPDEVIVEVLADWRADLKGLEPDPDPETNVATQLATRVLRQLRRSGLSLDRVSAEWQTRLEDVERE